MAKPQFEFLEVFVEKILAEAGIDNINKQTRDTYLPQFVAEAERRLAEALNPGLSESDVRDLDALIKKGADQNAFLTFWKQRVPNFEARVEQVLGAFAKEMKDILARTA